MPAMTAHTPPMARAPASGLEKPPARTETAIAEDAWEAWSRNFHARLTDADTMRRLADLFTALADTTRLRIIEALSQSELCVGELSALLSLTQSATSHQLRILRDLRVVKPRRAGRQVYYSLDDDHIASLFTQGLSHIRE